MSARPLYSSFSPRGRLTAGLAVTVCGAGKCDRGVCVKFLSWGTRLHISPFFWKPQLILRTLIWPLFTGKAPASAWVGGTGPFATLRRCSLGSLPAQRMWGGSPPVSMAAPGFIRIPFQMRHNSLLSLPPSCSSHLSPPASCPLTVFQWLRNLSKVRDGAVR